MMPSDGSTARDFAQKFITRREIRFVSVLGLGKCFRWGKDGITIEILERQRTFKILKSELIVRIFAG